MKIKTLEQFKKYAIGSTIKKIKRERFEDGKWVNKTDTSLIIELSHINFLETWKFNPIENGFTLDNDIYKYTYKYLKINNKVRKEPKWKSCWKDI